MSTNQTILNDQRLQHQLEVQSHQIEQIFQRHDPSTQVAGGRFDSQVFQFDLQTQLASGWERLRGLRQDLMGALGVSGVRVVQENGQWRVQVRRPYEPPVPLLDLMELVPAIPEAAAVLGLTAEGRPIVANFGNPDTPHVLITGDAGAGKSVLLRTVAASLALRNKQAHFQLALVSPTLSRAGSEQANAASVRGLNYLPHMLTDCVTKMMEIQDLLQFLANEMAYREEQAMLQPRIVVLIDHAVTVLERGGTAVQQSIQQLSQHGAASGIHLVLATRRPAAPELSLLLRTNFPLRVVGLTQDRRTASAATDQDIDVQANYLLGEGDFVIVHGRRQSRFQAAYIGDYDLHMSLQRLHAQRPVLLARPYNPRPRLVRPAAQQAPPERAPGTPRPHQNFTVQNGKISVEQSEAVR